MESTAPIPCPLWATFTRVDEVIECVDCGPNHREVWQELLSLMPDAYDVQTPGENDSPWEPDHPAIAERALSLVWDRLKPETQKALSEGYERDYGR